MSEVPDQSSERTSAPQRPKIRLIEQKLMGKRVEWAAHLIASFTFSFRHGQDVPAEPEGRRWFARGRKLDGRRQERVWHASARQIVSFLPHLRSE